jgi:hypothetical protein
MRRAGFVGVEGGMVNSLRPILFSDGSSNRGADDWQQGVRATLARCIDELREAVV